jgi:hypothetical protein
MASRATFLSPPDLYRLDWACRPIRLAFGTPPYLVGSALEHTDYRDIDLRLILDDQRFNQLVDGSGDLLLLLNIALSGLITATAGQRAPIDFQIQCQTEANKLAGKRVPMGGRDATGWDVSAALRGDQPYGSDHGLA